MHEDYEELEDYEDDCYDYDEESEHDEAVNRSLRIDYFSD